MPVSAASSFPAGPMGSSVSPEGAIRNVAAFVVMLAVVLLIALPLYFVLSKSVEDAAGHLIGLQNFVAYSSNAALRQSVYNSLFVSVLTAVITVPMAFAYS